MVNRIAEVILDDGVIEEDERGALDLWFWAAKWIDEAQKARLREMLQKAKEVVLPSIAPSCR